MAGVEHAALERVAAAVSRAEKLGVLLSLPEGRCAAASAVAALGARLAETRGGGVCPLLTYGNAVGARRVAAATDATPMPQLLAAVGAGSVKKLVVLGTDLVSALPASELSAAEILLAASAMPSATTARARAIVPMALWFEIGGTVVDGAGQLRRADAVAAPAGGALTPTQVLRALGSTEAGPVPEDELQEMLRAAEPPAPMADALGDPAAWDARAGGGGFVLVSRSDAIGFADGSISTQLAWPALMEPRPVLRLHPRDAQALGGGTATLRANGTAAALPIAPSDDVPQGVAALSARFPEMRALFPWNATGAGPAVVTLENSGGND